MIDQAKPLALYNENSTAVESKPFYITPGEVALIQGYGFPWKASKPDNTTADMLVSACLEMLIYKDTILPPFTDCNTPIIDLSKYTGVLEAWEMVCSSCGHFSIDVNNNLMLLDIPGAYRFKLNDATVLGTVRMYMRIFSHTEFPRYSKLFMGEE